MNDSEAQAADEAQDPGLSEAPTGAPPPETDDQDAPESDDEVNQAHPNEGEIKEAVEDA